MAEGLKLSRFERFRIHASWAWEQARDWILRFVFAQHNARVILDFELRMVSVVHEATGGMMSKPYYSIDAILPVIRQYIESERDDAYQDGRADALAEHGLIEDVE